MAENHTFPREFRIRRQADFDRAYQTRTVAADDVLVLHGCRNRLSYSRLGLSVSRRVGNAVLRNRWKRLIREAFRRQKSDLPVGYDFVVRPRRGARADHQAIADSLPRMARLLARRLARKKA
jgi:ribonuclease P protein component